MSEEALVAAYVLDGRGGGEPLDWNRIADWEPSQGVVWVHLNQAAPETRDWLQQQGGLSEVVVSALLADETRPRCELVDGGLMLFLRGVNLNPGADPEDMVSIRMWLEESRIVSVRRRRLLSVDDLREALQQGRGPCDVGEFTVELAERLISRMAGVVADIDDEVDRLQDQVLSPDRQQLRSDLSELRRAIIALRRYLSPQRDALARLSRTKTGWLGEPVALRAHEQADRVTRYVEDLDSARERAAVTQEELANRLSEQMNSRMYVLSIIAGIFLPLGFLTGLLGINVGGIPLAESPWGFVAVLLILVGITALEILVFRWRRWL